jgi:hypothetical protein
MCANKRGKGCRDLGEGNGTSKMEMDKTRPTIVPVQYQKSVENNLSG